MIFESGQFIVFLSLLAFFNAILIIGLYNSATYDYCHELDCEDGHDYCDDKCIDNYSKMVLYKFRYYSIKYLGDFWSKPVITCPICMASLHSTYIYWNAIDFSVQSLLLYPLYILFLSGMINVICSLIKK